MNDLSWHFSHKVSFQLKRIGSRVESESVADFNHLSQDEELMPTMELEKKLELAAERQYIQVDRAFLVAMPALFLGKLLHLILN